MPSDTELLDFLQAMLDKNTYTGKCIFRWSTTERGFRLHETSSTKDFLFGIDAVSSVRQAIQEGMIREEETSDGK